jgi:hypothetical protein
MAPTEMDTTAKPSVPQAYRQGLVTAITVFLGFSLSFMRFWSFENPGDWSWQGILSACILAAGIGVQLFALFRSSISETTKNHAIKPQFDTSFGAS